MNNINILIIIVIVIISYLVSEKYTQIPKKIWTYWDNPNTIPKTVVMCMKSWEKHNPNYEIVLLTKDNYKKYINIPYNIRSHPNFHDNPQRFSDLIRIYTLEEHGGVWIDSSILLKAPLNNWLEQGYQEFSGFYFNGFTKYSWYPVIENWFFACTKKSLFVQKWKNEFINIANYKNVEEYIESRRQMGVDFEKFNHMANYLAQHVAAQKIIQIDNYPIYSLNLREAESGPYKYLVDANWDSKKALQLACKFDSYQTPLMKLRRDERNELEKEFNNELSEKRCGWLN